MNGLIVDLFAGGGGASTGLAWALGRDPDIAINHDAEALAMHRANHPHTRHMQNDITRVLPLEATGGHPVAILHASPDCTHFSKAKGGKPKSQYIRDLAWVVIRWAEDTHPNLITLENVEEFLTWGPLDKNGQPIKEQAGATFAAWRKRLVRLGYRVEWRLLRACDYGAPTTRRRLFVVARRDKGPIVWPAPTHGNLKSAEVLAGKLLPWRTAAECIDWSIPSQSIFDRKKPLVLATQRRIAEGLRRYVLQAAEPFIVTYYGAKKPDDFRGQDLGRPLPTQTTENRFGLVAPVLSRQFGRSIGQRVDAPHPTITQCNHDALVAACITKYYGKSDCSGVDEPFHTLTSKERMALTSACLVKYYGTAKAADVGEPMHTITAKARMGLVEAEARKGSEPGRYEQVREFLRAWGVIGPEDEAEFVYEGVVLRIMDILMRMLAPRELYTAQGFPPDYIIDELPGGKRLTKTAQIRMCGNSVPPEMVEALVRDNGPATWDLPVRAPLPMMGMLSGHAEGWA
ncbi:DNA cytosine methyltransferase [Desulfovibrio fairfieldensis]|uniref:DNA (cytosine-5-)-methyltransferase n=1 Tax=Desulfovibrio fairfieldensis TaxID=44742 RepID=A0A0X8JJD5_9BACT|nr:DNA cytosine methyltransferase [Desulfovibrio fairfieldensis]AMD89458.1 hypothetical protein AXF13_04655 [Desulfovibrio fairfieldensis]